MTDIFDKSFFTASFINGYVVKDVLILSFVSSAWRISFETRRRRSRLSFIRGAKISWQYFQLGPSTDAPVSSNKMFSAGKIRLGTGRHDG